MLQTLIYLRCLYCTSLLTVLLEYIVIGASITCVYIYYNDDLDNSSFSWQPEYDIINRCGAFYSPLSHHVRMYQS